MKIYNIPNNYEEPGRIFNGMIPFRNAVDAVILGLFGYLLASFFAPNDFWDSISWYILCVGFFALFGLMGVQGIPLSTYLLDFINWSRRRAPYFYNHHGSAYSSSAADVMLESPQLRDHVAHLFDSISASFASKNPEFIEGETFLFAEDPELAFLQNAEEEPEGEAIPASSDQAGQPEQAAPVAADASGLDFDDICDNITLSGSDNAQG